MEVYCQYTSGRKMSLYFDLKSALYNYEARTGIHLTYDDLSKRTDISVDTLKSIGTRKNYNTTLKNIETIAKALETNPIAYFEWSKDE